MLLLIASNYLYIYLYFTLLSEEILMRHLTNQQIFFNKREMVKSVSFEYGQRLENRLSCISPK